VPFVTFIREEQYEDCAARHAEGRDEHHRHEAREETNRRRRVSSAQWDRLERSGNQPEEIPIASQSEKDRAGRISEERTGQRCLRARCRIDDERETKACLNVDRPAGHI